MKNNSVKKDVMKKGLKKEIKQEILQSLNSSEEEKWINVAAVSAAASGSPTFVDLTTIGQGNTSNSRNGDTVKLTNLRLAFSCIFADATNLLRVTLFRWLMNNTSDVPSTAEIFQDATGTTRTVLSPFVVTKPSRFKILYDKVFNLDSVAHPQILNVTDLKLKSLVSYDTGTSTGRGHIYLSFISDSGAIPHPAFSYESFVKFHDD